MTYPRDGSPQCCIQLNQSLNQLKDRNSNLLLFGSKKQPYVVLCWKQNIVTSEVSTVNFDNGTYNF